MVANVLIRDDANAPEFRNDRFPQVRGTAGQGQLQSDAGCPILAWSINWRSADRKGLQVVGSALE